MVSKNKGVLWTAKENTEGNKKSIYNRKISFHILEEHISTFYGHKDLYTHKQCQQRHKFQWLFNLKLLFSQSVISRHSFFPLPYKKLAVIFITPMCMHCIFLKLYRKVNQFVTYCQDIENLLKLKADHTLLLEIIIQSSN